MAMKSTEGEAFVMSARLAEISELVTDLPLSRVMLANDARFPWLMLIPRRANMQELFDLSATEQGMLMREITAVSRMLKEADKGRQDQRRGHRECYATVTCPRCGAL